MDLSNPKNQARAADFIRLGQAVIEIEAEAVAHLSERIDSDFAHACELILACTGRVVVTGMGKSGHIGSKIAATLASTGTPAFFVHPGEASHGDLGMITPTDVVLAMSNSGETDEVLTILPLIKRLGAPLISITGRPQSTLAEAADAHLNIAVEKEACPLNLAPTASTTATLAMGDALAVALLEARGFTAEDFAMAHPGGSLGRRLLLHVRDIMHAGDDTPRVTPGTSISEALMEMTRKGMGFTVIADDQDAVLGVFTDGDLRRVMDQDIRVRKTAIDEVMTVGGKSVEPAQLAASALELMDRHKINALPVIEGNKLVGAINMHDLLRAGVV